MLKNSKFKSPLNFQTQRSLVNGHKKALNKIKFNRRTLDIIKIYAKTYINRARILKISININ